jgi:hypothetical protein
MTGLELDSPMMSDMEFKGE